MGHKALILFGALFVGLFAALGVVVGIGSSSKVPPGVVAAIEDAPRGIGTITRAELEQAMLQSAAIGGLKRPLRPGDEEYEQRETEALSGLISAVWLRGQGEEMGVVVTDREAAEKLERSGEAPSLREMRFTRKTMLERVRGEILVQRIEAALEREAERASTAEARAYYEEEPGEEGPKKPFAAAKHEAVESLQQIKNQEVFSEFDRAFPETWQPRTHCAEGFVIEGCSEYPDFAHVGPPACYEKDPEEPAEACPAAVPEAPTAQPGSVTPFKPTGESFVQRPYPEVLPEGEAVSE